LIDTGPDEFVFDRFREGTGCPLAKPWNNSDIPGLWSGSGEGIMTNERDIPFAGLQRNKKIPIIGNE